VVGEPAPAGKGYASPEARAPGDHFVLHQTPHGGWPKNKEMAIPRSAADAVKFRDRHAREAATDNGATTNSAPPAHSRHPLTTTP
jgi:hypothetical protein